MNLPTIKYFQLQKIHEISEKLTNHIQALQTLVKLNKTNGYVRNTLNKLAVIRADLLRNDKSARVQEWDLPELLKSFTSRTERNLVDVKNNAETSRKRKSTTKRLRKGIISSLHLL